MALRKEDLDDDEQQEDITMKRSRITIDVSPGLRRRIKIAALQNDLSISEYLSSILEQALAEDTIMTEQPVQPVTRKTLAHVLQVRNEILEHTNCRFLHDST